MQQQGLTLHRSVFPKLVPPPTLISQFLRKNFQVSEKAKSAFFLAKNTMRPAENNCTGKKRWGNWLRNTTVDDRFRKQRPNSTSLGPFESHSGEALGDGGEDVGWLYTSDTWRRAISRCLGEIKPFFGFPDNKRWQMFKNYEVQIPMGYLKWPMAMPAQWYCIEVVKADRDPSRMPHKSWIILWSKALEKARR